MRLLVTTYGAAWTLYRMCAVVLVVLASGPASEVAWIGVPLGGGTNRVAVARQIAARHPGARLVLAGTRVEVDAARRWLTGSELPIQAYVVEPASTYACVVALRHDAGTAPGLLVTDGSHVPRARLSWALAGGLDIPPTTSTSPMRPSVEEAVKFLGYLARH